jgi:DNA-binding NarL/FixJ family response regulator
MSMIRVLIADDHAVVRDGLARVIGDQVDMRVVAQVEDGDAALSAAREHGPHVVLLDMRMPGSGGASAIKRLREQCPASNVLVLSMYEERNYVRAALAAGAHGYLSKRASSAVLVDAIRKLHRGEALDPPEETSALQAPRSGAESIALSAREREVIRMVVQGHTSRAMADALGISKSSVDTYRARIFRKFGVDSRAALAAKLGVRAALEGDEP